MRGHETAPAELAGIILSGSPYSVYDSDSPRVDPDVYTYGVPVLGICYGLQETASHFGARVEACANREYGHASISVQRVGDGKTGPDALFADLADNMDVRRHRCRSS